MSHITIDPKQAECCWDTDNAFGFPSDIMNAPDGWLAEVKRRLKRLEELEAKHSHQPSGIPNPLENDYQYP